MLGVDSALPRLKVETDPSVFGMGIRLAVVSPDSSGVFAGTGSYESINAQYEMQRWRTFQDARCSPEEYARRGEEMPREPIWIHIKTEISLVIRGFKVFRYCVNGGYLRIHTAYGDGIWLICKCSDAEDRSCASELKLAMPIDDICTRAWPVLPSAVVPMHPKQNKPPQPS